MNEVLNELKDKLNKSLESIQKKMATIRAGRASTSILDEILVNCYGTMTPLNQLANLTTLDTQTLFIDPWDKSIIKEIEKAIQTSNLGLTPNNDGKSITLRIPTLTQERRFEYVKLAKKEAEDGKVAVRNIRKDINNKLRKLEKDSQISEDELKNSEKTVQKDIDLYIEKINDTYLKKEKEIMTI